MLTFIIPLRHRKSTQHYDDCLALLRQTLESVYSQENRDFHIIIVCDQAPWEETRPQISFLEVDLPPPDSHEIGFTDKGRRLFCGLKKAVELNSRWVMFLDADDFVHFGLSRFCKEADRTESGWYFEKGWVCNPRLTLIAKKENFHLNCGSSHIFNIRLWESRISAHTSWESIPADEIKYIYGDHVEFLNEFSDPENRLKPLPFRGAVWRLGTSVNWSGYQFHGKPSCFGPKRLQMYGIDSSFSARHFVFDFVQDIFAKLKRKWRRCVSSSRG